MIQTVEALRAALPSGPARSPDSVLAGWTASVRGWLPRGGMLPPDAWAARHRGVQRFLVLQVLVILAFALREHHSSSAGMLLAAVPVAGAIAASLPALGRSLRSCITAATLMLCAAVIVHLDHGATEAHFLFFVMIPIIVLYEDWLPFGLAVGFVLVEHGLMGTWMPMDVYSDPAARVHPWQYAGVHAGFFAAAAAGCAVNWKLQELSRASEASLAQALNYGAWHDRLTGLPNRGWLLDQCALVLDATEAAARLALISMDVARFKDINDAVGQDVGDQLLQEVAARLLAATEPTDRIARTGGHEFAVVLAGDRAASASDIAERIRRQVTAGRVTLSGVDLDLDITMGVAFGEELPDIQGETLGAAANPIGRSAGPPADTRERLRLLMRQGEVAMYAAEAQRVDVGVYDLATDRDTIDRLGLLTDLREALYSDQLALAYQPKIGLADGQVHGVEALLRWTHPSRGPVPPMDFIPAAEATNLITPLSHRVLGMALLQAKIWIDEGTPMRVSVNVPPRCLVEGDFASVVSEALQASAVPPTLLCLELTETSLMTDVDAALGVIGELRELGIELSIDDFGTGFSSLSYLRRLPVGELKIDKSFVQGVLVHRQDQILIKATIDLAHQLGMSVVAEGVEDEQSAAMLAQLGCDLGQGYLYSMPLTGRELFRWIHSRGSLPHPVKGG